MESHSDWQHIQYNENLNEIRYSFIHEYNMCLHACSALFKWIDNNEL